MICIPQVKHAILLGFETIVTYNHKLVEISWAMYFTSLVLLGYTFWHIKEARDRGWTFTRLLFTGYTFSTAVFALIRATIDTNKVLLVGAALHNLFEWGIFFSFMSSEGSKMRLIKIAAAWIALVIAIVFQSPVLRFAFLFEQVTGLTCDYLMVGMYAYLYCTTKGGDIEKRMYLNGLIASLTHFGQIWTLIALGLGGLGNYSISLISETLLNFSSMITFYYDKKVADGWDDMYNNKNPPPRVNQSKKIFAILMVSSLLLSIFTLLVFPNLISKCEITPVKDNTVVGITVINTNPEYHDAMKEELSKMLIPVASEDGSIDYNLYENHMKRGSFAFIEKWLDLEKLKKHLDSPNVKAVFHKPYFQALKSDVTLFGPWSKVLPLTTQDEYHHVFKWDVDCSLSKVWNIVGNFSDSTWVYGVESYTIESRDPPIKKLYLSNGGTMKVQRLLQDDSSTTFVDTVLESALWNKFEATVRLEPANEYPEFRTQVTYSAVFKPLNPDANIQQISDMLKADFFDNRIPFTRNKFNCPKELNLKKEDDLMKKYYSAINEKRVNNLTALVDPKLACSNGDCDCSNTLFDTWITKISHYDVLHVVPSRIVLIDNKAAVVEDIMGIHNHVSSLKSQISLYTFDESRKYFTSKKTFNCNPHSDKSKNILSQMKKYYQYVNDKKIEDIESLYTNNHVIYDPVGKPPKSIRDAYGPAFAIKRFNIQLLDNSVFICDNTFIAMVKVELETDNFSKTSYPIQQFDFVKEDEQWKINVFHAYFESN